MLAGLQSSEGLTRLEDLLLRRAFQTGKLGLAVGRRPHFLTTWCSLKGLLQCPQDMAADFLRVNYLREWSRNHYITYDLALKVAFCPHEVILLWHRKSQGSRNWRWQLVMNIQRTESLGTMVDIWRSNTSYTNSDTSISHVRLRFFFFFNAILYLLSHWES